MPTKIPEAMAMGVPVIATDVSDMAQQIGDGGLVVPPGDVSALAAALDKLLDDESLAHGLRCAARRRAVACCSMTAVRPEIEKVFEPYVAE
jgi:glycosyltransferase involved in cell wall biosynthesis